jgi:hypothetical protein
MAIKLKASELSTMSNSDLREWCSKAYKKRLRVHRIRKIVRLFNIDVTKRNL